MNIKDLLEKLEDVPDDAVIKVNNPNSDYFFTVKNVEYVESENVVWLE